MKLMEDVTTNKRKMKELEDNLLYRLTSTQVSLVLMKVKLCSIIACFRAVVTLSFRCYETSGLQDISLPSLTLYHPTIQIPL